ncbi:MAG: DoxX family protein [Roseibium sp.]|uniref:DoxX family protein n=1 Tax=Roseibium sp. TaxID=1936156 RepID=UPI0026366941|nr:DoxX family protein [Roseibium sp.]MCV0424300.1 DoxX family protein [Roseibium sp.]
MGFYNTVTPYLLSLLRFISGLVFLQAGTSKFLNFPHSEYSGTPAMSLDGVAGMIELVCGVLISVGLLTRPAAFLASGTMAVAYFLVLAPKGFFPMLNGGDSAILFCFVFLFLAGAGGGPLSLDRFLFGKRSWVEKVA